MPVVNSPSSSRAFKPISATKVDTIATTIASGLARGEERATRDGHCNEQPNQRNLTRVEDQPPSVVQALATLNSPLPLLGPLATPCSLHFQEAGTHGNHRPDQGQPRKRA